MRRNRELEVEPTRSAADVEWTTTVTARLPDCPSVRAGWERLATQTRWPEWRSASEMRSVDVATTLLPPATEPLSAGDEYVVRVSRFMNIRCRVLESFGGSESEPRPEAVFDAVGLTLGGLVRARFRFTLFTTEDGTVVARAQEKVDSPSFLSPDRKKLAREHEHTFRDLNESFLSTGETSSAS